MNVFTISDLIDRRFFLSSHPDTSHAFAMFICATTNSSAAVFIPPTVKNIFDIDSTVQLCLINSNAAKIQNKQTNEMSKKCRSYLIAMRLQFARVLHKHISSIAPFMRIE